MSHQRGSPWCTPSGDENEITITMSDWTTQQCRTGKNKQNLYVQGTTGTSQGSSGEAFQRRGEARQHLHDDEKNE